MWLKVVGFIDRVAGWWECFHFDGSRSYVFAKKLKALKVELKKWNLEVFGWVVAYKSKVMALIQ